ncbi:hypothetical protein L484_015678 [Morus notabilis]|uniref:CASP-like protein n=1 Tax=Morus notabilis TaxID=981085 RepID=W9S091_9ROSA|nr:casparian strip membrane protein 1 [Morus notabilis]EXC20002.1 hypothetical protein L484_015678 [Morus notabilis]
MKGEQVEVGEISRESTRPSQSVRVLSLLDFILRIIAALGTLASAIAMGTSRQTLSFVTRFTRFRAVYKDLPTFTFFVIANSIVCVYLVVSLCLSFIHIIKSAAVKSRIFLVIFDTVMMGLLTAGASAAAAIVAMAHNGSTGANWVPFCQQFRSFCDRISGSLIGSFVSVVVFILIIIVTSVAISRR